MSLTYTDIFCGAGGSSAGLRGAGLELRLAANHWARAIETHSANFVDADHLHLVADVSNSVSSNVAQWLGQQISEALA